jgi:hypothetical protein
MRILSALFVFVLMATVSLADDGWRARVTDEVGVEVSRHGTPVIEGHYVFWGKDWSWAGAKMKLDEATGGETTFTGAVGALGFDVKGVVSSPVEGQLQMIWKVNAKRDLKDVIGGGLELNLDRKSPALGKNASDPELLDDNGGIRWQVDDGEIILIEFPEPLANLYFERGNKGVVRVMFLGGDIQRGEHVIRMKVALPAGGQVEKSLAERYGPVDSEKWIAGAMAHDRSPVDLSLLNHRPAGKFGFVKAKGDALVYEETGEEARFWGGNIAAHAIFEDKERIKQQAKRIAQLGYNLMRIHHHDSTRWVGRTVIDKTKPDSRHFDDEVMDRLDYWIKCLKEEGVYVWLDLHVGREFKPGDDIGEGFPEMAKRGHDGDAEAKGYCYFNDRVEMRMREFNEKYLNHVNRYTGVAYKDEPAVMGLLITNENDLTCHFGNLMLPDKGNPWHNAKFDRAVRAFAGEYQLPYEKAWRTWEPGPSKLFLADWEYWWNRRMLDHLKQVGVKVPISTTQMWGGMSMFGLPSLSGGGIVDVHSYGKAEAISANPRYQDNFISYMATGQLYGKPLSITEWNVPYPAVDRFTAPLYVASVSALQGWDAPMIYNYSQRTFETPSRQGTWSTFSDPAITAVMPAAALLYRRGDIAPAKKTYCLMFDAEQLYHQDRHPRNMAALRTLVEQSKVTIGLPRETKLAWSRETDPADDVIVVRDLDKDFIAAGKTYVAADHGQMFRNWALGVHLVNTPRTKAAQGWIGGRELPLGDVVFDVETSKATVAVSSLQNAPIAESKQILITAVARVAASSGGKMPMLSEPVEGVVKIRAPAGSNVIPLAADGTRLAAIDAPHENGFYVVTLPAGKGTHWYLLAE